MEENQDPLHAQFKKIDAKDQDAIHELLPLIKKFYENLSFVMKHGSVGQKRVAAEMFNNLQEKMRQGLQAASNQKIDLQEIEKLMHYPGMESSKRFREIREELQDIQKKFPHLKKNERTTTAKKSALAKRRRMEKNIRSKL